MLGGTFRASFRPLNDAIIQGRIKGVVGIVGCNNPKSKIDAYINTLTRELIKRERAGAQDRLRGHRLGQGGHADARRRRWSMAGPGLREVCEAVGMPPVLHMGSCVDNSRILEAATEVVLEGGLGDDLSDVPAVGVAPEWMSEKADRHRLLLRGLGRRRHPGPSLPHRRLGERHPIPQRGDAGAVRRVVPRLPEDPHAGRGHRSWRSSNESARSWASTRRPNASSTI